LQYLSDDEYPDFCTEMKYRTKKIHDVSNRLVNLKVAVVVTDVKLWAQVIAEFYYVFRTLEECFDRTDHPLVRSVDLSACIRRTEGFESDLEFFLGADWKNIIKPSATTTAYCARLNQITAENPLLLIAYIHSMYLGLLAGGQMIKRIMRRTLGVKDGEGLRIFDFVCDSRIQLKKAFMTSINELPLSRDDKEAIVKEKVIVFRMNNLIIENIKPSLTNYKRLIQFTAVASAGLAVLVYGIVKFVR